MGTLDWMAAELRAAGLQVREFDGWRTRAVPGSFAPRAVMWHHDASALGPSPGSAHMIALVGHPDVPPPLAQAWVDMTGTWVLVASGRANHAGKGGGFRRVRAGAGNTDSIGIETDHTDGDPWPAAQLDSLRRGTRVLLDHLGAAASDSLVGHKEYAPDRKHDPSGMDMHTERQLVAALDPEDDMAGEGPNILAATMTGGASTRNIKVGADGKLDFPPGVDPTSLLGRTADIQVALTRELPFLRAQSTKLGAQVNALVATVAALSKNANLTADEVRAIVVKAVQDSIKV